MVKFKTAALLATQGALMLIWPAPALAIVSSNANLNINHLVGAERFYDAGYTGTRSIQANIESGHVWSGHSTLAHVTTQVTGAGALGDFTSHATRVGAAMGGRSPTSTYPDDPHHWGIAYGAEMWSGAIATQFLEGGSFSTTGSSVASTYSTILQTGVDGRTADVFNSSWSFNNPTGTNFRTRAVDGLIYANGTVGVVSAGNIGPDPNTVRGFGAGYNSITAGMLEADTHVVPYNTVRSSSSRGPNDFGLATSPTEFVTIPGVRAAVDITAPGRNLTLANFSSPSNPNLFSVNNVGTSFAAPIVAGGASLIVDAGKDLYSGDSAATDGRVVKAVLLNSADRIPGWNNGQSDVGGVIRTTQSLDWAAGAGRMNLDRAFDQFVTTAAGGMAGTTNLAGVGGDIAPVGWNHGWVDALGTNTYFIDQPLIAGSNFTTTLVWFADREIGSLANFSGSGERHLANLDLRVVQYDDPASHNIIGTVAESVSHYNVVEHLAFEISATGYYGLQVSYAYAHWNFTGAIGEKYGLAWFGTPAAPLLPGDLNGDGVVDAADYVFWRKIEGGIDQYDEWRANFGRTAGSGAAMPSSVAAVPEPGGLLLCILGGLVGLAQRGRTAPRALRPKANLSGPATTFCSGGRCE